MTAPPYDTVISGAGISRGGSSPLPNGDELARIAWLALFDPVREHGLHRLCGEVEPLVTGGDSGLRLEHLIEVLSRSVPLEVLVRVYDVMRLGQPNSTHAAIASMSDHAHFTLNMDTLLEGAGFPLNRLTHLHGRWDDPDSIITTISQYLAQLPPQLSAAFTDAVHGRNVLVVGYSGRDFDVFPLLQSFPPRSVRWLVHPGGWPLDDDVELGLRMLADTGCAVDTTPSTIFGHLGLAEPPDVSNATIDVENLAASVRSVYGGVSRSRRALGAARVMFEIGALDAVHEVASMRPCGDGDGVWLRKIEARAYRRRGDNLPALRQLVRPPTTREQFAVWRHNGNEIANLISHAGLPAIGTVMDHAMFAINGRREGERPRTLTLMLRVRLGQRASVVGDLRRARVLLDGVARADDVTARLGPAGEADAITWLLDVLKGTGEYVTASDLLPRLRALTLYTNLSQRAYALWQAGAVDVLCGEASTALPQLQLAASVAERSGDSQATGWVLATLSDALRGTDSARARNVLDAALADPPANYLAHQYLLIQAAEQARHEADFSRAASMLQQARTIKVPGRLGPRRSSMNYLAVRMIALLIAAERDPRGSWRSQATRLHVSYVRRGALAAAADVAILLDSQGVDREHLSSVPRSEFDARGWREQADRADSPWDWRRPWRVIA